MSAQSFVESTLASVGISVRGGNPWDITVHDERFYGRVLAHGSMGLGESYMDGWWDCRALDEFFYRIVSAHLDKKIIVSPELVYLSLKAQLMNLQSFGRAKEVAIEHYDLPDSLFEAMLDPSMTYTCAYWEHAETLQEAQEAKHDLVCRKLGIKKGDRVLDIGCGRGAFMAHASEKYGATCVGISNSKVHIAYAKKRYKHNLSLEFRLMDYRDMNELFDHIVSIGMFEAVGYKNFKRYFEVARRCLKDNGLFLLHTLWGNEPMHYGDPWVDRYIFPNGVLPTIGEIDEAIRTCFIIEDLHNFGPYYVRTLHAWNTNFQTHRDAIAKLKNERFCRMWEYYLLSFAGALRARHLSVGQFVLSPAGKRVEAYHAVR